VSSKSREMRWRKARMPHLRHPETIMHLRRAAKKTRHSTKLHPDSRTHACLAISNCSRDSDGSIEKFAHCEWAGAKVCYSPKIKQTSKGQIDQDRATAIIIRMCAILFVYSEVFFPHLSVDK
jgi:hypothetical protein